jgi:hypothetical protein
MIDRPNYAPEIRRTLTDPRGVCEQLGIITDNGSFTRQSGRGVIVRCPSPDHVENTPSCSIRVGPDGTIAVKCFGCEWGTDVLGLIAAVRGLSLTGAGFRDVLVEGARLAGLWGMVDELEGRSPTADRPRPAPTLPQEAPEPPRTYPAGVESFWAGLDPVTADDEVAEYLSGRAIDPERVEARDLARTLPSAGSLPSWALCRGGTWREANYRLIVPVFDTNGELRGVRGWRVGGDPSLPKRIPPFGCRASGLLMADSWGLAMLRGTRAPERVVITEGEPDTLVWGTRLNDPSTATIGIVSGSWSSELAMRFPIGCRVDIRTHADAAGDRYAAEIESGLRRRCFVFRSKEAA